MKYNDLALGQVEAIINKLGGMEGVKAFLSGAVELVVKKLILPLGEITTPGQENQFVAKEKFSKDSSEVKFWWFGSNFESWFLDETGKVEQPIGEFSMLYGDLTKDSVDEPIIEELGGEAKVETTLQELYFLLKKQRKGQEGELLTNGWANIFYIRDASSVLRAVVVYWDGGGWCVGAYSVEFPRGWLAGYRVFSRNS